jgi:O-antigen ligase
MALLAIVNYFVTLGRVVSNSEIFFPIIIVTVLSLFLIGNLNLRNRIILSVIIIINLFAVFVSLTRSMWIGLLGGILVLMLFAVTLGKISLKGNNIAKYILSGSVLIGVVAVLLRFNSFLYNVVKTRFGMIIMGGYDWSVLYRLIEIKKVMEYIPNHFLFGGGMGATIVTPLNITTHARISEGTPYIHNTFFYWLLKFGILGSLLWYLLWIAIIVKMVRLMKNQKDTLIQGLQLGSIVSILLLAIYSLASPHLSDNNGQFFLGLALALFYPHKIKYKTGI